MIEPEVRVADIVVAAGGRIVSRVRLQKIAYLIDKLGANSGFSYSYHHFGPYSRDLDSAILDADAFGAVKEDFGFRKSDNARYSVFTSKIDQASHNFSFLVDPESRKYVSELAKFDVTILELAATAHWLLKEENIIDWKSEIVRRKGAKTDGGRLQEAVNLLKKLGLEPASL